MEPFVVILMEKNKENGFLENEMGRYPIADYGNLIDSIYVIKEEEKDIVHLKVTTEKEVMDWEFSAILDYYDEEALMEGVLSYKEVEEAYNPTWKVMFELIPSQEKMKKKLEDILSKHKKELEEVYNEIKDKKEEYE